jgi:hypothetical protein
MYSNLNRRSRSYYPSNVLYNENNKIITQLYKKLENNESISGLLTNVDKIIKKTNSDYNNTIYTDLQIFKNIVKINEAFENFTLYGVFKKNHYGGGMKPIKTTQNVRINKNIFLYLKKYGPPKDGIFDPEKLSQL